MNDAYAQNLITALNNIVTAVRIQSDKQNETLKEIAITLAEIKACLDVRTNVEAGSP